jgi:hypothetical protein
MRSTKRGNRVLAVAIAVAGIAVSCGGGGSSSPPPPALSVTVSAPSGTVNLSATLQFTATVQNATNTAVTWSISPSGVGSIDQTGKYTAPDVLPVSTTVTAKALSQQDNSTFGSATVTVTSTESVSAVTPATPTVDLSVAQQFSATVSGSSKDTAVVWSIRPASGAGTLSASGLYTAPKDLPASISVTVTATSHADTSKASATTVTIGSNEGVSAISPADPTVNAGAQQQFSTTVSGSSSDSTVTWSAVSGSITSGGLYTAPAAVPTSGTDSVTVKSNADPSKSASTTVTITSVSVSAVTPATPMVDLSAMQQFSATVSGSTDTAVLWSISPASGAGTITTGGLYTAPNDMPASTSVTVKATSHANANVSSSTTATIASNESVGAVSPAKPTVNAGAQQQFSTTVSGSSSDSTVTWSAVSGSITSGGLYTAPTAVPAGGTDSVTAKSNADPSKSASTTVTIAPIVVSVSAVSPPAPTVDLSATQQFSATVTGSTDTAVVWSINPASGAGTISASGLYTAPNDLPASTSVTVKATSHANANVSSSTTATIASNESVGALNPGKPTVATSAGLQFSTTVTGSSSDKSVTWSAVSGSFGAGGGAYTAPAAVPTSGTDTVIAKSNADPSKSASTTVTITASSASTLSSLSPIVAMQNGPSFTLTVNGSGFSNGNTVLFNGKSEMTTFVNSTQLTASVSPADLSPPGVLQVTVQTGSTVTAPMSFYVVPSISAQQFSVSPGGVVSSVNVNLSPLQPTLFLELVGTCAGMNCSASQSGTSTSLSQAIANGGLVQMYIAGIGIVPGTFFVFTGPPGESDDITVTQPVVSDFPDVHGPTVSFNITVSGSTALGLRSITVMNSAGEISVFPGALLITP